jgi:hypothetical protein
MGAAVPTTNVGAYWVPAFAGTTAELYASKKSTNAVSASTASGMLWRAE